METDEFSVPKAANLKYVRSNKRSFPKEDKGKGNTCPLVYTHVPSTLVLINTNTHTRMHIHTGMHTQTYAHSQTCTSIQCLHAPAHIYTYTHKHIHRCGRELSL